MLASLSHRARTMLRQFLSAWTTPAPQPTRLPRAVAEAMDAASAARARNDCRAIGRSTQRLRQARLDGLRRERASKLFPQQGAMR